tara:strand:- start:40 stop:303 length:264 start_codon:yes stop_codon:yes gene_type:complete
MILNNEKQSKEELTVEDNIADVMNMEPDIFMAEAITVLSKQPLATKRRLARNLAAEAKLYETQANMSKDRYASKQWNQVSWALRTLK